MAAGSNRGGRGTQEAGEAAQRRLWLGHGRDPHPRLRLRRARLEDLEALHAVLSEPRAMRYWSTPPHCDLQQTREFLGKMIAAPAHQSCDFVIERDGRAVGKGGCYRLPEVGYILHPDHWGQGLATEALRAIIPHLFANHPVERLKADVDPWNRESLALLAKLGFVETHRAERIWRCRSPIERRTGFINWPVLVIGGEHFC